MMFFHSLSLAKSLPKTMCNLSQPEYMNPIYITAISTLIGVGLTLFFTNKREKNRFLLDNKHKEFIDLREYYIQLIASLDKTKRLTEFGESYKNLTDEMSLITAKANLLASEKVNEKLYEVSKLMYIWSSNYKRGLPKSIGETGLSIKSSDDIQYQNKANEIEPKLDEKIGELIEIIKDELQKIKLTIK